MKNLKKQSAVVLCALFATMQISLASIDTGLGAGNGGAVISGTDANFYSITGANTGNVDLNFTGNSHVQWNTLNVNNGESLNFNAVNGANGLTILNTVNSGMSKIYGQIGTNDGIGKLIISNPNGVLFDGAKFTTAGDVMITSKDMSGVNVNNITDGTWTNLYDAASNDLIKVQILNNSDFSVGGEFKILAPKIVAENSKINAGNGLKLITANGADYVAQSLQLADTKGVTFLKAMNINGNVEIVNDAGALSISDGGKITGDLDAEVGGLAYINTDANSPKFTVTGNADIKGHGEQVVFRNSEVNGNLKMTNDGGSLEINNMKIDGNADLTTTGWQPVNHQKYNHYVHVIGDTHVGGDLNIESSQNIHIGGYEVTQVASNTQSWAGNLKPGKLTVDGNLNAHTTGGHITTTIDTSAKNINYNAEKYNDGTRDYGGNILSDGKAVLKADTYQFKSAGYIGGLQTYNDSQGVSRPVDNQIVDVMENYTFIPADVESHDYLVLNGGTITKLETPKQTPNGNYVQTYIKSNNDLTITGANAGDINLVAPDMKITITGDVKANEVKVGGRTGTLQLDFPKRDFTTKYINIKDGTEQTIKPDDEITYELTNKPGVGYNSPDFQQTDGSNTTYLVGPGAPVVPPSPPDNPKDPDPNDPAKLLKNWAPEDPMTPVANTPVAFAADLDEDEIYGPCRKNVDGSVTVVRAYPMVK